MFLLCVGCVSLSMKHAPILYRSCLSLNEVDHRSTWDIFGISLPICWETKRNDRLKSILQVDTSVPSLIYVFRMHLCTHKLDDHRSIWASEKNSLSTSWPAGLTVIIYMSRICISFMSIRYPLDLIAYITRSVILVQEVLATNSVPAKPIKVATQDGGVTACCLPCCQVSFGSILIASHYEFATGCTLQGARGKNTWEEQWGAVATVWCASGHTSVAVSRNL